VILKIGSSIIAKLKECKANEADEVACFKAIPELAKCFGN
jgi:hypothetical protein